MEKYHKVHPAGKLYTSTGQAYWLLSPMPIQKDSWQLDNQQRWVVVPLDRNVEYSLNGNGGVVVTEFYPYARHIVTTNPTIEYITSREPINIMKLSDEERVGLDLLDSKVTTEAFTNYLEEILKSLDDVVMEFEETKNE